MLEGFYAKHKQDLMTEEQVLNSLSSIINYNYNVNSKERIITLLRYEEFIFAYKEGIILTNKGFHKIVPRSIIKPTVHYTYKYIDFLSIEGKGKTTWKMGSLFIKGEKIDTPPKFDMTLYDELKSVIKSNSDLFDFL